MRQNKKNKFTIMEGQISIVVPVFQAGNIISELIRKIHESLEYLEMDYELILVNDGSTDNSWNIIAKACSENKKVKGINLSRNFGQHNAITAGLRFCNGEWIVVMDCDLQDRPEEIPKLYLKALEGYDSVFAQRINRNDALLKRKLSRLFYSIFGYLTDTKQDPSVGNFGIYHRQVIDAVLSMKDQIRYFPTMVQWVGFRKFYLPVQHDCRYAGVSNYHFSSLYRLAINNIIGFSDKPLRLTVKVGFIISIFSFVVGVVYVLLFLTGRIEVLGFTSIIISIWFLAGVIILILGILGLYIGKMFEKVKERPYFLIMCKSNL